MIEEQIQYYKKRAKEYELVYQKLERQNDLNKIKQYLIDNFRNENVIEIACGTGYWTKIIARDSSQILGIDINKEVIEIAKQKNYNNSIVNFEVKGFKELNQSVQNYDGIFGGFIWSHIPKQELNHFISIILNLVKSKGQIIFIDNKFVEGNSTPIPKIDQHGNSFQKRTLINGEEFEIIKNYPTKDKMIKFWGKDNFDVKWIEFEYYWLIDLKKR